MALCSENLGLLPLGCGWDWFMGIEDHGGCFNLQEQHQQQVNQQALQNQRNFNRLHQGGPPGVCGISPMTSSQSLPALLEKQRLEIDWVLHLQSERLKTVLIEERKKQVMSLLQRCESRFARLICQKEEDIAMASSKTIELEECLRRTELEREVWQRKANENEAIVLDLHNTLSRIASAPEEAESFCNSNQDQDQEQEMRTEKMMCKLCNVGYSSVVFLPCRHLCCCKQCEAVLGFCPVCESLKEASLEVFMA